MEIAHLTATFPKISETFIMNQLVGLINRGHEVQVFANERPNTPVEHELVKEYDLMNKSTYSCRPNSYTKGIEQLIDVIPDLIRMGYSPRHLAYQFRHGKDTPVRLGQVRDLCLNADNADLLHAHFGTIGNSYLPAQHLSQLPLVVSFYGRDVSKIPQSNPSVYDELFETAAVLTCLSNDMKEDIVSLGGPVEKVRKVPLCVDPNMFDYQERELEFDESIRILTVARHVEKKGLEYAIEAVAQLDIDHPVTYRIVGDGPRRERLENLIDQLDAGDRIEILGWKTQNEVAQLMTDAHVFLLPSVTATDGDKEGTPTVLLEAQATGLPVVSTTHAGIPEIVNDGDAGLLVPERDVAALVDALERILNHPERWAEMGRMGREYVERHHSIESVTEELISIYQSAE